MPKKKSIAKILGGRGGKKTAELYGKNHYKEAQKKSVEARKKNKLAAQKLSTEEDLTTAC